MELLRRGWSQKSQGIWLFLDGGEVVGWGDPGEWGWRRMGCILDRCIGVVAGPESETGVCSGRNMRAG